jgi:hypothetical protein
MKGEFCTFEKHALNKAITGWKSFTMMENAMPDIALTAVADWQSAQILMVNTYRTIFPHQVANVPFGGSVYPAELVTKTVQLERDIAAAKQALEERDLRIKALEEQNARANAARVSNPGLDPSRRQPGQRQLRRLPDG